MLKPTTAVRRIGTVTREDRLSRWWLVAIAAVGTGMGNIPVRLIVDPHAARGANRRVGDGTGDGIHAIRDPPSVVAVPRGVGAGPGGAASPASGGTLLLVAGHAGTERGGCVPAVRARGDWGRDGLQINKASASGLDPEGEADTNV
ncbi:hypothetical protein GCM10008995_20390 [Halobellus salinus]|uniref:Uncharacterized protein n=1 Tax=Halobellus salinus TaxID=931585 RepID=A0A830EHE9_9EURY|nr:hypothetical protein GCM10008995_20390 [Halobellus salinus]